jgi:toxin CcdB
VSQLDVYENPIVRARRAYPFVAVLQSDLAETGRDRIVAPLVPRKRISTAGKLTPHVSVAGVDYVVLVPNMTAMPVTDLRTAHGKLTAHRDAIVAALDYLFSGCDAAQ